MSRERFVQFLESGMLSLPQQLKGVLRLAEDPDLPDEGRVLASGAIVHWLSSHNTIPGVRGPLSYLDDLLIIRLTLARLQEMAPEVMERHAKEDPDLMEGLADQLELMRSELGDGMAQLDKNMGRLGGLKHMGKTATQCATDEEAGDMMYEEFQAGLVDLDLDEAEVKRLLRGLDKILASLKR